MLNINIKKIIALGISLVTLTGTMPVIISPIPVFASQEESEKTSSDCAEIIYANNYTTYSTTSANVKVSNYLEEFNTIANLNGEVDTGWSSINSLKNMEDTVIINRIEFQLINPRSKYVSVTGSHLKDNTDLVLPRKIECNGETFKVTSIGESAFKYCNKITSITIPSSIESIENEAFLGCTLLTKINVDTYNSNYESKDGVLFNKNAIKLIQYPIEKIDEKYEIPSSVIKIEDYAFLGCNWKLKYIVHNEDIKKYLLGCNSRIQASQITVVTVDTSKLGTLYNVYKEMKQGNYTDKSFKIFIDALQNAKKVLDKKTTATQTEVDNEEKALQEAINALKQKVEVTGITVSGLDSISQSGGSINLTVSVSPDDATNRNVTWSILSGDSLNLASITQEGLLTASGNGNGSVIVRATATDGSNLYGEKTITIKTDTKALGRLYDKNKEKLQGSYTDKSFKIFTDALNNAKNVLDKKTENTQTDVNNAEQELKKAINGLKEKVAVKGITVSGADSISQSGERTNLIVSVSPNDAINTNVTWSIVNGDNLASITQDGILTSNKIGNGSITVRATANDGSGIYGEKIIKINNNASYIITASAVGSGTIIPSMVDGESKTYVITPNSGYEISDVLVDGVSVGIINKYTFENIRTKHTISATFKLKNNISNTSSSSKNKSTKILVNNTDKSTIIIIINIVAGYKGINCISDTWHYLDNISKDMDKGWIIPSPFLCYSFIKNNFG